jgi:modification methylase
MNKILLGDCYTELKKIEDNYFDLIITSPPYNKNYWVRNKSRKGGKRTINYEGFNDNIKPEDYIIQQKEILTELVRVLKPNGSIFYNHIDIFYKHNTIHPHYVYNFPLKQIIIWDRANTPKLDKSYFLPTTEYIFWIKKSFDDKPYFNKSLAFHKKNIWRINIEKNKIGHPAQFPKELVNNIILSCSKENDKVLDCYMGSGTTALCCKENNRLYLGIEQSQLYIDIANDRLK